MLTITRNALSLIVFSLLYSSFFAHDTRKDNLERLFAEYPENKIVIDAFSPGLNYQYDIGEKDEFYHKSESFLVFDKIIIEPAQKMFGNKLGLKFSFLDRAGNKIVADNTDIFKLTPGFDCSGDMLLPEVLSEEYNRFGIQFRRWRNEFSIEEVAGMPKEYADAFNRIYRVQLVNNCLEPTKWEVVIDTEDYSDYKKRRKSDNHLNQRRIIAHSWFNVPLEFYKDLLSLKNPNFDLDLVDLSYEELSQRAERVKIDFSSLRGPVLNVLKTEMVEVGHKSERKIVPLDSEEYYKKQFGLILSGKEHNYKSILDTDLSLTRFKDRGFYRIDNEPFYIKWLRYVDDVKIKTVKTSDSELYSEICIGGEFSPYEIVLGNVDLALMNEQILCGFLFGVNTYITNINNKSTLHAMGYDPSQYPDDKKPYLYLLDKKTGKWVNNQFKGVEKVYVSYDDIERDVVTIHVLSYERIIPVWMARVKLPSDFVEQIRVRRRLFNY
ncbi:MAG: hypothetical protein HOK65_07940 [Crocinitomicaceae bacterium]|nr:hypothetical protein [Crocinitomicaceae bacterium]